MNFQTSSEQNESQGTVSVSLKGIPTDQGLALKEVARARDINQSAQLREMVNASMGSILHVFCLKSPLVASLDQDTAQYNGCTVLPAWGSVPPAPQFEAAYRGLLGIHTEDDLTRILLRNAQYLRMRTHQVMPRGTQFYGGAALYFALFCDVAGRDEQTIEAFWATLPAGAVAQFQLPGCNGHILTPDPGYGTPYIFPNNAYVLGFRFREESCSLHCYSVEHVPIGDTQTLSELAQALVDGVDETLRAYAATIPVNQR
ncbi:hypothetical protein RF11_01178 [Thelohanellus kitauei]|uniref:Uncharacterized protein n=1 Tax=Thelohanellus kitauei TaxID=669202 RepID=A0A0C2MAS5_THEKT|nr:hypothetical protein RF11_01178 [Thelohanellus kitauei]